MFDSKIHLERRLSKNRLKRISVEAERQQEEDTIARWLTLGDEALDNTDASDQGFWTRRSA